MNHICYAIPAKITSIDKENAQVDYGGISKKVNISLLDGLVAGDYILIHAGFAIEKLDQKTAEESIRILKEYMEQTP